ncbi:co-chaperone DjlA [Spongorhabdus nitratireducens]
MHVTTILGILIGLVFGGPFGAVFGGLIGYWLDNQQRRQILRSARARTGQGRARAQSAFFQATFMVMGRVSKADGLVSQSEIDVATGLMGRMGLTSDQRRQAIDLFNQGKQPSSDIDAVLKSFRQVADGSLIQIFLEIQLQAAYADGNTLSQSERAVLGYVCDRLGIGRLAFDIIHRRFVAQQAFYARQQQWQQGGHSYRQQSMQSERYSLSKAYGVLGVESEASDAEIKKAYRKLMSQHHPDKLVAKGLPPEMMDMAKQKTQEIQAAYDAIRSARKGS